MALRSCTCRSLSGQERERGEFGKIPLLRAANDTIESDSLLSRQPVEILHRTKWICPRPQNGFEPDAPELRGRSLFPRLPARSRKSRFTA